MINDTDGPRLKAPKTHFDRRINCLFFFPARAITLLLLFLIPPKTFALQWQTLTVTGQVPTNGLGHSAVFDSSSDEMIVYGGYDASQVPISEVWVLANVSGSAGPASWAKLALSGGPARSEHSAVYDAANKRMIVFGGFDETTARTNQVWVLSNADGTAGTPTWTRVAIVGPEPPPRRNAYANYGPISNRLIIFGGEDDSRSKLNDVWV